MTIETIGSFLPDETLITARQAFEQGKIDREQLSSVEDNAVRDIVRRQIAGGLPYVTSGELRRKHWANDFWFGLNGLTCENVSCGHIYQPIETSTDNLHITGRIEFNPEHPFFHDFSFLHDAVEGKARCRQTLPSPANLLLEIYALSDGRPQNLYPASVEDLIADIAQAYRLTAIRLHELGCESLQYDDTALGLMCDDNYTKRLLQGGVDLIKLQRQLIAVINTSLQHVPDTMEKSIYISVGDTIVPEWEYIDYPDNIMPKAFTELNVDKFFIPFKPGSDYAPQVLRHIPADKAVVLGLADAHCPFPDDPRAIVDTASKAAQLIDTARLAVSTQTGFKLSSYTERALLYEDQWHKLSQLSALFSTL